MTHSVQLVSDTQSSRSGGIRRISWQPLLGCAALLVVGLGFLLSPTVSRLHIWWTTGYTYTHGYLVVLMCLWLGVEVCKQHDRIVLSPSWLGLIAVFIVGSTFSLSVILSIDALQHLLLPALILSVAMAIGGMPLLGVTLAPALLLYMALPIWEVLNPPLQWLTIAAIGIPLAGHDFPVVIDGMFITVPAGEFHVAGGCSGLHYLLVAIIISYFLAVSDGASAAAKARIVGVAIILALMTNWIRVYTLILIGQYTDMQHYLIAEDHYFYGWVLFGVAMAVFYWIVRRWTRPNGSDLAEVHQTKGRSVSVVTLAVAAVLGATATLTYAATKDSGASIEPVPVFQQDVVVYRKPIGDWRPKQALSSMRSEGVAIVESVRLEWFVALYAVQGPSLDIASGSYAPFGDVWALAGQTHDNEGVQLAEIEGPGGARRLIAWRTQVAGETVVGGVASKLAQLRGLASGRTDATFAAVSVDCDGRCSSRYDQFSGAADRWFSSIKLKGRAESPANGLLE